MPNLQHVVDLLVEYKAQYIGLSLPLCTIDEFKLGLSNATYIEYNARAGWRVCSDPRMTQYAKLL